MATIGVNIVGDASVLERELKKADRATKRFQGSVEKTSRKTSRSFGGMGRGLVGLGAGVGISAVIKDSVLAASDLEQQIGKTSVVFGDSAKEIEAWSKTTADAFGLSQREALTTASSLGALFAPIGLTGNEAAKQSQKLTELGADLASFYNTDVQSALDAIRSGLVGEAEPLRKYGVLLTETRVQQQAMADTGKRNAASLTAQEKVLARIKIVYQDSASAQGDFARTSDDAAQKAKIAQANIENLKVELGGGLVPALAKAADYGTRFAKALRSDSQWNQSLLQQFQDLGEQLPGPLGEFGRKHRLPFTSAELGVPEFPRTAEDIKGAARYQQSAIARRTAAQKRQKDEEAITKYQRAANEAMRQQVQDRAQFAVDKTELTKTLTDDLAALRAYLALLNRRAKGGHKTLELEREQLTVQLQIQDVLRRQAESHKRQASHKKKMGVDVTRFQVTARGQFVAPGGGGRGLTIAGGVHLHGIQNVSQLENELARRSKQRPRSRRRR